jgi:thioredoxin reductase
MYDVIIVGGSGAGLSAALSLGRSLRKTLVIHNGKPCNAVARASHNFLTHDGDAPAAIAQKALKAVKVYPSVTVHFGTVVKVFKADFSFKAETETGEVFVAQKLIFANGLQDTLPPIKGFKDCWGITALHCPYCHGYEFKDRPTGLILDGTSFLNTAATIHQLSKNLVVLTNGIKALSEKQNRILTQNKIEVVFTPIEAIEHENGRLHGVVFTDGTRRDFDVLYTHTERLYNSQLAESLGCALGAEGYIKSDWLCKTNVPGVFACGEVAGAARSVAVAVAAGNTAGIAANTELCNEAFF